MNLLKYIKRMFNICPECGDKLDNNHHGFKQKWLHCHNCGYCTYDRYFKEIL